MLDILLLGNWSRPLPFCSLAMPCCTVPSTSSQVPLRHACSWTLTASLEVLARAAAVSLEREVDVLLVLRQVGVQPHPGVLACQLCRCNLCQRTTECRHRTCQDSRASLLQMISAIGCIARQHRSSTVSSTSCPCLHHIDGCDIDWCHPNMCDLRTMRSLVTLNGAQGARPIRSMEHLRAARGDRASPSARH
jgi:hypothetical protein